MIHNKNPPVVLVSKFFREHNFYTHGGNLINFIEMFTTMRNSVVHMNQVLRSKVKVTLTLKKCLILHTNVHHCDMQCHEHYLHVGLYAKGQGNTKRSLQNTCPEQTAACIKGFQYNLAGMISIMGGSVMCKKLRSLPHIGVKSQVKI
jgi:hypothetical protein